MALTPYQADILARTIAGEADQTPEGRAAVAAVIMNRSHSGGAWPSDPAAVALQRNQFSAWRGPKRGGNSIPFSITPSDPAYQAAMAAAQGVADGTIADPTGGAVNYYAPSGMAGKVPSWAQGRQGEHIGTQIFFDGHGGAAPTEVASAAPPSLANRAPTVAASHEGTPWSKAGDALARLFGNGQTADKSTGVAPQQQADNSPAFVPVMPAPYVSPRQYPSLATVAPPAQPQQNGAIRILQTLMG